MIRWFARKVAQEINKHLARSRNEALWELYVTYYKETAKAHKGIARLKRKIKALEKKGHE